MKTLIALAAAAALMLCGCSHPQTVPAWFMQNRPVKLQPNDTDHLYVFCEDGSVVQLPAEAADR